MYSIWAEPVEKDAKYLSRIIRDLGKKYGAPAFAPHITVYGKIRSSASAKSAILNCVGMKKFAVKTTGISFSKNLWKTVFINAEKNPKLLLVHDAIRKSLAPSPKYEFHPHISLIYKKMADSEKQSIIGILQVKQKFTIGKITVIQSSKSVEKWRVIDRVVLR